MLERESIDGTAALGIRAVKTRRTRQSNSHLSPAARSSNHAHTAGRVSPDKLVVPLKTKRGWALLLEAHDFCQSLGRDAWDFAVDIQSLRRAGLTNSTLRWMICQDWLTHADELPSRDAPSRVFRRTGLLTFSKSTCFVLTLSGVDAARQVCQGFDDNRTLATAPSANQGGQRLSSRATPTSLRPCWNPELQQLHVGELLVKEFKLPCPNQGMILMAFEEEEWPLRIDDPLPPSGDIDPRTRLRYTIKSLNKRQKSRLIRFIGDGTGMGIRWEFRTNGVSAGLV